MRLCNSSQISARPGAAAGLIVLQISDFNEWLALSRMAVQKVLERVEERLIENQVRSPAR